MTEYATHGGHGTSYRPVKRITFDVPPELHAAVKDRAAQQGESMSELFRRWALVWLGLLPPEAARPLALPDPVIAPVRRPRSEAERRRLEIAREAVAAYYAQPRRFRGPIERRVS